MPDMTQDAHSAVPEPAQSSAQGLLASAAEQLPTPDGIAMAIMRAWEDDNTTTEELARLVQTDPALTGRVLKLANSAATGCRPVAAIPEAIVRVGMQTVGQMAVAFSLIGREYSDRCENFDYQEYWSTCLLLAVIARSLGDATRLAPPADLFACGLLARIGVLGLASVYPEAYAEILDEGTKDLCRREQDRFGLDHNELSEAMMLDFVVPRALAEPARHHEEPEQSGFDRDSRPQKIAVLLNLAYRLAELAVSGEGKSAEESAVVDAICASLGLPEGRIKSIYDLALKEWAEWLDLLELPSSEAPVFEDLPFDSPGIDHGEAQDMDYGARSLSAAILADPSIAGKAAETLGELGVPVQFCPKPSDAMQLALERRANLFLVIEEHAHFIDMIRNTEAADTSYVFWLLIDHDPEQETKAFEVGSDDVIPLGIVAAKLAPRLQPAKRMLERFERWRDDRKELRRIAKELALSHRQQQVLALTDQLTGLPNRRAAMDGLGRAWSAGMRAQTSCAAMVLDLDHFKKINDHYGHAVGDQTLRSVAAVINDSVRGEEIIARIGGEEFLLISSRLDLREAVVAGERLRRQLLAAHIDAGGDRVQITVSIGIAVRDEGMRSAEDLLIAADKALYAAKEAGRNRVAFFQRGKVQIMNQSGQRT